MFWAIDQNTQLVNRLWVSIYKNKCYGDIVSTMCTVFYFDSYTYSIYFRVYNWAIIYKSCRSGIILNVYFCHFSDSHIDFVH